MNDDIIFRYVNGRIVPIRINKDITTNEYMNKKIKGTKQNNLKTNNEINNYEMLDTGVANYVAVGKLKDGNYFVVDDDNLSIYNSDYKKAFKNGIDNNWIDKHLVNSYKSDSVEYGDLGSKIKEFKINKINDEELTKKINGLSRKYSKDGMYNTNQATRIEIPIKEVENNRGTFYNIKEYLDMLYSKKEISKNEKDYLMRKEKEYKKK